ncbi:hypothetical protein MTO96_029952 [Rhipicephalus appendiculatus]
MRAFLREAASSSTSIIRGERVSNDILGRLCRSGTGGERKQRGKGEREKDQHECRCHQATTAAPSSSSASSSHTMMAARFHPAERDLAAAMTPTPPPSPYYEEEPRKTRDLARALPKKDAATAEHERRKEGKRW